MLPQTVRPYRGQYKPNGIPRIDPAHPLARGLVFYGYDIGGTYLDLAGNRQGSVVGGTLPKPQGSSNGSGVLWNNSSAYYFPADASIRAITASGIYSFFAGERKTGFVGNYSRSFGYTSQNGSSSPFVNWAIDINPAGAGQNVIEFNYCNSAGFQTSTSNFTVVADNVYQTYGGVATGADVNFYGDGAFLTNGGAAAGNVSTGDGLLFSGSSTTGSLTPWIGFVYYGAFWSRPLTPSEVEQLHWDPYCFLIYPEDDELTILVGAVGGGSVLSAGGNSTANFVGAGMFSSVLTAPGSSAATFTGSSLSSSAFSANGSSVATFNGSPLFLSVLTAAGSSTGSFVGSSLFSSALTANGASSVNFIGAPISLSILTAVATSSASFISGGAGAAAFTVGGSATASFVGATRTSGVFIAAGLSSAIFTSPAATFAAFSASGSSSLSWSGSSSVIVNTTGTRFYDRNLAYSYPPGVQKSQILSYDPVNDTLVVTTISGDVFGWYARGISPTIAIAIANAPDKRIFINTILGFPPVTVVFID